MHPVEDAERLTKIHQNEPSTEAEKLFPQAVLKLRVDSKRRDDPKLERKRTMMCDIKFENTFYFLKSANKHDITMILERMRKEQISCMALLVHGAFSSWC